MNPAVTDKMRNAWIFLFVSFLLVSCGGGGSDSPDGPDKPTVSKEYINVTPNVDLLADGQTQEVKVSANCDWTVSRPSDATWLTVSPSSGTNNQTLTLTAGKNSSHSSRTAVITISGQSRSATITVTQAGQEVSLALDKTKIDFKALKDSSSFNITCGDNWTLTAPSWCMVSPKQGRENAKVTVSVKDNTSDKALSGNIVVKSGDNKDSIAVTQQAGQYPVISGFSISEVGSDSVGYVFTVKSDLPIKECGVCYATSRNPTVNDRVVKADVGRSTISGTIYQLSSNTTYYARAYAINAVGMVYSSTTINFTTKKSVPHEGDNPTPAKKHNNRYYTKRSW